MLAATVLGRRLLSSTGLRFASSSTTAKSLILSEFGLPEKVLVLEESSLPSESSLADNEVLINILAAPINPSDINTVEGNYPLRPELPGTPGHEGVGIVSAIGSKVTRLRVGDRAVPIEHSQGTWRTHGVFQDRHWYRIPHDLPIATAATMVINPPTALRLLEEYVTLSPGDTIIQTGATSAVGRYILQLARHMELHTINVIRDRPNRAEVERELKDLGATLVVTHEELGAAMADWKYPVPKLALDCVGGNAIPDIAKTLEPGGTIVVYGSMSKKPFCLPPGLLIFKDIRVRGFWLTGGYAKMKDGWKAKEQLVDRVCALFRQKVLKPVPVHCVPLHDFKGALERHRQSHKDGKVMLTNYGDDVCL